MTEDWVWEADIPTDIRDIVRPHLDKWGSLIPTWCQDFSIRYNPRNGALCAIDVSYKYRWGVLIITGQWLEVEFQERETALIHELIHLNIEPMASAGKRIVESLEPGSLFRKLAEEFSNEGLEASVQDLAHAIRRLGTCEPVAIVTLQPDVGGRAFDIDWTLAADALEPGQHKLYTHPSPGGTH